MDADTIARYYPLREGHLRGIEALDTVNAINHRPAMHHLIWEVRRLRAGVDRALDALTTAHELLNNRPADEGQRAEMVSAADTNICAVCRLLGGLVDDGPRT